MPVSGVTISGTLADSSSDHATMVVAITDPSVVSAPTYETNKGVNIKATFVDVDWPVQYYYS